MFVLRKRRVLFVVPPLGGMKAPQAPPEGGTTNNGCAAPFSERSLEKRPLYGLFGSSHAATIVRSWFARRSPAREGRADSIFVLFSVPPLSRRATNKPALAAAAAGIFRAKRCGTAIFLVT